MNSYNLMRNVTSLFCSSHIKFRSSRVNAGTAGFRVGSYFECERSAVDAGDTAVTSSKDFVELKLNAFGQNWDEMWANLRFLWNLGKSGWLWANVFKFKQNWDEIWTNLIRFEQNQNLASPKTSVSYSYVWVNILTGSRIYKFVLDSNSYLVWFHREAV